MAAAVNPISTAIILLLSAAAILATSTTSMPPLPPLRYNVNSLVACAELLFALRQPPPSTRRTFCRDLLRTAARSFSLADKLSPEYVATLKKLPDFQNHPEALRKFLCGLSPAHLFGCDSS